MRKASWRTGFMVAGGLLLIARLVAGCHARGGTTAAARANGGATGDSASSDPASPNASGDGTSDSSSPTAEGSDGGASSTGAPVDEDAGPPAVRFVGRFDTRDANGPTAAWPGTKIIASFQGSAVSVRLNETVESWMEGGPSTWDASVDGAAPSELVMQLGDHVYPIANGLAAGSHTVELYRRTEAQNGYTQFLGFDFAGGTLLPPPLRPLRRIEVIGDSAAAGFGILGSNVGPDCPGIEWGSQWQDFHLAFPQVLADQLGAELHGTVYSGKGMARNIWRADTETMPVIYGRANPIDPASPFDLGSFVPDVVVIMIGGNDFALGQPQDDGPLAPSAFDAAYSSFVDTLRGSYPNAHLFLVTSPSVTDEEPPGRYSRTYAMQGVAAVVGERNAKGDTRVYSVVPDLATPDELTACDGHGTPAFHQRVAATLAATVREKTGWQQ